MSQWALVAALQMKLRPLVFKWILQPFQLQSVESNNTQDASQMQVKHEEQTTFDEAILTMLATMKEIYLVYM